MRAKFAPFDPGATPTLLVAVLIAALLGTGCGLEPLDLAAERPLQLRSTITAADGSVLARLWRQNRVLVAYEDIPRHLIQAVLAAEDARFFSHPGYDLKSIARAALANMREGEVVQGGSTITQQYVKNTYFRRAPRTIERKARELRIALEVERTYSKREILERYLNTVYFGGGAYGVVTAARTFFGHGLEDLAPFESALLAAVIKSPSTYAPRENPKAARDRRDYVIGRMAELGWINALAAGKALETPLLVTPRPPRVPTRQPYFVEAVRRELMSMRLLGADAKDRADALYKGGITVETTLEPRLQAYAENAVASVLNQPGDPAAAVVVIRPSTGEIVAMVGGKDWKASQVNLALGLDGGGSGRQPGSSFKPLVLAAALEAGYTLDDRFDSAPAVFQIGDTTWTVRNAEGGGYGRISLTDATVHSVNGVYARLALELGTGSIVSQARHMGVRSPLPEYPSIALGSAEVSVLDMAAAYATLANGGTAIRPTTVKAIRFPTGETRRPEPKRTVGTLSAGNAWMITNVLQEVMKSGTGTAAAIGRPAAGKTGTTNDYADAWFVGYTPDLVAAVWVGYPQGRVPMTSVHGIRVYGGTFPALIWKSFMLNALQGVPPHDFRFPREDLILVEIDPATGLLAAPWCPGKLKRMLRQLAPTEYCPPPPPPTYADPEPEPEPEPGGKGDDKKPRDEPEPKPSPKPSPDPSPKPSPKPSPSPTP